MRWTSIADSEDMNSCAEETMALLAEVFELSGAHKDIQPGILKWVLATKPDKHWQTTKATAAAIDMLQKEKGETLGKAKAFSAQVGKQQLSVSRWLTRRAAYDLIVAHEGEFTSGPAKLQCMYKPALNAYSDTMKIKAD